MAIISAVHYFQSSVCRARLAVYCGAQVHYHHQCATARAHGQYCTSARPIVRAEQSLRAALRELRAAPTQRTSGRFSGQRAVFFGVLSCRPDKIYGQFEMTANRGRSGVKLLKRASRFADNILFAFLRSQLVVMRVSDSLLAGGVAYVQKARHFQRSTAPSASALGRSCAFGPSVACAASSGTRRAVTCAPCAPCPASSPPSTVASAAAAVTSSPESGGRKATPSMRWSTGVQT